MSGKKDKLINILLVVAYVITLAIIIFLTKSNVFNKNNDEDAVEVIPNSGFEKFEVKDLETQMKKLTFVNKKQDYIQGSVTLNSSISSGKVTISIKSKTSKKEYVVPEIEDAKSIGSYIITTPDVTHISYILTESGKVYKIVDDIKTVNETDNYVGTPNDLGLTNVDSIAVDHKLKNTLLEDKTAVKPFVYIKTDDSRYFTDEELIAGKDIVELIELKEELETPNVEENTSES